MRGLTFAAVLAALAFAAPASAVDSASFTLSSPTVRVGSSVATKLCELGVKDTVYPPPPSPLSVPPSAAPPREGARRLAL